MAGDLHDLARIPREPFLRSAYALLGNTTDAEDAVQETFPVAIAGIDTFRNENRLSTWVYGILLRVAGRQRQRRRQDASLDGADQMSDPGPSPDARAADREEAERLRAAVDALPDPLRLPVLLYYLAECPVGEVAASLGIPEGTVKRRLFDARARLSERLHGTP